MAVTITTSHGEYVGPTLAEVIAREYGDRARPMRSADQNNPRWGMIVESADCGHHVLAELRHVEGEDDAHSGQDAIDAAVEAHQEMRGHEDAAARAMEARNTAIRQAVRAGVTQVELCKRLSLSRSQMRKIVHKL